MNLRNATKYNNSQLKVGALTHEHVSQLVEFYQQGSDLEDDGMAGPATLAHLDAKMAPGTAPDKWTTWDGPEESQPKNRRGCYQMMGRPGGIVVDPKWKRKNIIELHGANRLPGVPARWYVQVHQVIEPYLREALRRAAIAAPDYKIKRLGGFNYRRMRSDPASALSMHAFGIAVDIDAKENSTRRYKRGKGPKLWSEEYFKIWPNGVPKAFVEAFQSCGFAWGSDWDEDGEGRDHTFYDPMHFEWVARDGNSHQV